MHSYVNGGCRIPASTMAESLHSVCPMASVQRLWSKSRAIRSSGWRKILVNMGKNMQKQCRSNVVILKITKIQWILPMLA